MELLGKFRVERLLKNGPGVSSWLAWDGEEQVVVKIAQQQALPVRLVYEAETMARLKWNSGQRLREYGTHKDSVFLVLNYLCGETLKERLERGPLELAEFFSIAGSLLETVAQVHEAGILHRDIKPENVVLQDGEARLIDFGFSRLQSAVGTVLYAAPETSGLIPRDVAETADLYSLGALFFHCLAGKPPFLSESAGDVLRQHLSATVPLLARHRPHLPDVLQTFLERLLAKEPEERYASALDALSDLSKISGGSQRIHRTVAPGKRLVAPHFVGREPELQTIWHLYPAGGCVLLQAPSGGGKSRFLDEMTRQAVARGALVLRGQALAQCGAMPFQLLAGPLYESLAVPRLRASMEKSAGPWREDLVRALPALQNLLGPSLDSATENLAKSRLLQAMYALLASWASPGEPVLLLLDDVQWADPNSLELLAMLGRGGAPPNLLLVAACRGEEFPEMLEDFRENCLTLPPLDRQESLDLLQSMGGDLPLAAWDWLQGFAEGNPFLLVEGLRGLSLRSVEQHRFYQASLRAATLLRDRIDTVGAEAVHTLVHAAILGRSFRIRTLLEMVGKPVAEILRHLEYARRAQILWSNPGGTFFTLAHDRLRDSLLEACPNQSELHAMAAEALLRDPEASAFELTFHYRASNQYESARPHALQAARMCRAQYQFSLAVEHYRLSDLSEPVIREELAEALFYAGKAEESLADFERLARESQQPEERARRLKWMGEICFRLGRYQETINHISQALEAWGEGRAAKPSLPKLAMLAYHWMRGGPGIPKERPVSEKQTKIVQTYELMGNTVAHSRGFLECLYYLLRATHLSKVFAVGPEICQQWGQHSALMAHFPIFRKRARAYVDAVNELIQTRPIPELTAARALARTVVYGISQERLSSLVPRLLVLEPRMQRTGDAWEWSMNASIASLALVAYGAFEDALRIGKSLHQTLVGLNQARGRTMAVNILARSSPEPLAQVDLDRELPQFSSADAMGRLQLRTAIGITHLRKQQWREAVEILRKRPEERTVPGEELAHEVWLCEALRSWSDHLPIRSAQRRQLYLEAYGVVCNSFRKSWFYCPFFLPRILREMGLVQLALGRVKQGLDSLRKGLERAEQFEHRYEAAVIRLERSRWRLDQGEREAKADEAEAQEELRAMGAVWHLNESAGEDSLPPLLPVRAPDFRKLLGWGKELTRGLEPAGLDENLSAAISDLLPCSTRSGSEQERLVQFLTCLTTSARESALRHESLRLSERRWSQAFEGAALGLVILDACGQVVDGNRYFRERLGGLALGGPRAGAVTGPDGHLHWVQTSRVRLEQGELVTVADVTHRHWEQLARLQEAERRLFGLELHDSLLGELTALKFRLESNPDIPAELIAAAGELLQDLSWLVFELRNPVAEGFSFYDSMSHYLRQFALSRKVRVRARLVEEGLDGWEGMLLYRLLQKVLEAAGDEVRLTLRWTKAGLLVRVLSSQPLRGAELRFRIELLAGRGQSRSGRGLRFVIPRRS